MSPLEAVSHRFNFFKPTERRPLQRYRRRWEETIRILNRKLSVWKAGFDPWYGLLENLVNASNLDVHKSWSYLIWFLFYCIPFIFLAEAHWWPETSKRLLASRPLVLRQRWKIIQPVEEWRVDPPRFLELKPLQTKSYPTSSRWMLCFNCYILKGYLVIHDQTYIKEWN